MAMARGVLYAASTGTRMPSTTPSPPKVIGRAAATLTPGVRDDQPDRAEQVPEGTDERPQRPSPEQPVRGRRAHLAAQEVRSAASRRAVGV